VPYYVKVVAVNRFGRAPSNTEAPSVMVQGTNSDIESLSVDKLTAGTITSVITVSGLLKAPSATGWRVEIGDAALPIRYWDGTTTNFSLDNAGTVFARSMVVDNTALSTALTLKGTNSQDILKGIDSGGHTQFQLSVTPTSAVMSFGGADAIGSHISLASDNFITLIAAADAVFSNKAGYIGFGDNTRGIDTYIYSPAASAIRLQGSAGVGAYLVLQERTAPATPATDLIRIYAKDKAGVSALYYKDDGGTEHDLSATGGLTDHDHTAGGDGGVLTNETHDGYGEYTEISAPSTPAANKLRLYAKDRGGDSRLHTKNDAGTEHLMNQADVVNGPATSTTTISNTGTETDIASYTVPANLLTVGSTYRMILIGDIDNIATSGNITMRLKWGTTIIENIVLASIAGAGTNRSYWIEALFTLRTTGATGTAWGSIFQRNAATSSTTSSTPSAAVTIDTTAATALHFTIQFATANAGNIWRNYMGYIELIQA
jgi:hypothetical protein